MPDDFSCLVTLRNGESLLFRLLQAGDAPALGDYFTGLSEATLQRYRPHEFTAEHARHLCATIDNSKVLRLVALTQDDEMPRIVAYFIVILGVRDEDVARYEALGIPLNPETDCTLAPSVADAYQDAGLGSQMMEWMFKVVGKLGRTRVVLWCGVQATNERAKHFYQKHGFTKVGEFYTRFNNWDMIKFSL
jgi:diamine N-acetyltransferase